LQRAGDFFAGPFFCLKGLFIVLPPAKIVAILWEFDLTPAALDLFLLKDYGRYSATTVSSRRSWHSGDTHEKVHRQGPAQKGDRPDYFAAQAIRRADD
jgi:hypothetical protein